MTYAYTIFDANPHQSGSCAWPTHTDVEVEAVSAEEALEEALTEAEIHGDTCGEYETGDVLYVLVWEDSILVAEGTHTVNATD
jgi:hypothetical protein